MTRKLILVPMTAALALSVSATVLAQGKVGGWDPEAVEKAEKTIKVFKEKDKGLVNYFDQAHAYAVFPSVGKGAVGIGGAFGKGTVFEKGKAVGKTDLKQGTIGFQFGGQAYSEIIFFETEKAFENFKNGNLKFSGQASVVAVTLGASADLAYKGGVAVVTMTKGGLMYEASVGGQHFGYEPMAGKPEGEKSDSKEKGNVKEEEPEAPEESDPGGR